METFEEVKAVLLSTIQKIKKADPRLGRFLEDSIILDEEAETIQYVGEPSILLEVLGIAIII